MLVIFYKNLELLPATLLLVFLRKFSFFGLPATFSVISGLLSVFFLFVSETAPDLLANVEFRFDLLPACASFGAAFTDEPDPSEFFVLRFVEVFC